MSFPSLNRRESFAPAPPTIPPTVTYSDCVWNTLHYRGWHLRHQSYTDSDTGAVRHLITARRGEDEYACSAGSLRQALGLVFNQCAESGLG